MIKTASIAEVRSTIRRFIADEFFVDAFSDTASFLEEAIVDSTGMLQLVAFVEGTYGVRVADDELIPQNLDSVDNVAAFVERKLHS